MNSMAEKLRRGGVAVRSSDFRLYRRLVSKTKKYIPLFIACTLVNGFAMFLIFSSVGVLLQTIFSYVTGDGDIVEVEEVGLYLLVICVFAFAGAFATTGFTYIEEKSRILIRTEMMNSYFKSDERVVADLSSGEVLNRINIDLNAGLNLIGNYMSSWIFQPVVSGIISVVFLMAVNWVIALLCVLCGVLNAAVLKMSAEKIKKSSVKMVSDKNSVVAFLADCIEGASEIRTFRASDVFRGMLANRLDDYRDDTASYHKYEGARAAAMIFIADCFSVVLLLLLGAFLAEQGLIEFAVIMLALPLVDQIDEGIIATMNMQVFVKRYSPNLKRIFEVMDLPTEQKDDNQSDFAFKNMYFEEVSFSYGDRLVLDRVSFRIQRGDKVAFVGESGSGKSTIVKLVAGLYLPDSGRINADGRIVNEENVTVWRRHIAYMPQDIFMFDADVKTNIALNLNEQDMDKVKEAAADAGVADTIEAAYSGYETKLSGKENGFSGGQLQRISLARTLYQDRDILVIDEPTSALDPETEKVLQQKLESIPKEKTVIAVTHRLNLTQNFDCIYVVKNGKIVEAGGHNHLKSTGEIYSGMWELQQSKDEM